MTFVQDSADNVYTLEVRDAAGGCLICDKGDSVTNGVEVGWALGGKEALALRQTSRFAYAAKPAAGAD